MRSASTKKIALWSSVPGCGKTTIASLLHDSWGFCPMSFAQPLKLSADWLLRAIGVSHVDIDRCRRDKETHIREIGMSYRDLLRLYGTEFARDMIRSDIWVKALERKLDRLGDVPVCIDDMRFLDEYEMLLRRGFVFVRVVNFRVEANAPASDSVHSSDLALRRIPEKAWDFEIPNDGSLEDLSAHVASLMSIDWVIRDE